jgi:hypothetical protein
MEGHLKVEGFTARRQWLSAYYADQNEVIRICLL